MAAAFLSPVFSSRSPSAGVPLGLARVRRWTRGVDLPVFGLGGVGVGEAIALGRSGLAGVAGVEAFAA